MAFFIRIVMADFIMFVIISLAVWRISSLLAREDGPFDVLARIRAFVGVEYDAESEMFGTNGFAKGLICVWCNSVWFSAVGAIFIADNVFEWFAYTLAISTVAIMVDSMVVK